MNTKLQLKLLEHLLKIINDDRCELLQQVVNHRTRFLTVVLENIFQPQNASAVMRTAECMGVQDLHVIENNNDYRINPDVVQGASKWITLKRYNETNNGNTERCLHQLRKDGYKIVALTLNENAIPLEALPLTDKTALCFGEEDRGLSDTAHEMADYHINIPMVGFTQSLNLSVSAAVVLSYLCNILKKSSIDWQLSQGEKTALMIDWLVKSTPSGESIRKNFLEAH